MKKLSPRRRARECALQAFYSWYISKNEVEQVELAFLTDNNLSSTYFDDNMNEVDVKQDLGRIDTLYFSKLLRGTVENLNHIDRLLAPCLDRKENEVDPVERSLLRLATYELSYELDVPYRVAINEAIEISKDFGSAESHKYVNGVLDKVVVALGRK